MPRSPIFRTLQRSLQLHDEATRTGEPVDEAFGRLVELGAARRVSRREFLAGAGIASSALALGGCRTFGSRLSREAPQVLIVGAGLAGLTAAHRLHSAGVPVRLIDAQERVGGRCFSLRGHFPDGQVCELGGELIDSPHQAVRALCREFEIELDDLIGPEDPALTSAVWHFWGQRHTEAEICAAFAPIAARLRADLDGLPTDASYRQPGGLEELDRMSLDAWLSQHGVSGWMRRLLEVAYTTECGLEPAEQSALNLLWLIAPRCPPFEVFGASDERYHVRGGNDLIVRALAERVRPTLVPGARLEAARQRADGMYEISVRRGARSETLAAPHLVVALPFPLLRQVQLDVELPDVKRRAIEYLGYGTNAKLMVGFESRPWRTTAKSAGGVFSDLRFQCAWETSRAQPGVSGILTNFTGGQHGVDLGKHEAAEQAYNFVAELEQVFPGVAGASGSAPAVRFHWPTHPWALGSYAAYRPGQWTSIRGAEGERVGNLHFAGEHCSAAFQGFMEGAVETGESVARAILADIGVTRRALAPAV
jgi:monoamine oxidase